MVREDLGGVFLAVISHARPNTMKRMNELVGPATWFVGRGERADYVHAAADISGFRAIEESGALCESRNAAILAARKENAVCVQLSDDLTKVQLAVLSHDKQKVVATDIGFEIALDLVRTGMKRTGAKLGGAAPTSNPFYANVEKPVHPSAFIVGDFIVVTPDSDLLFDEQMTLKEDYDFTLQHIMTYGCVARRDDVLMTFLHRKNAGGAVEVRTPELEQKNIAYLKAKWQGFIQDNPRRPNEILLKLPRAPRS